MNNKKCKVHCGDIFGDFEVIKRDDTLTGYKYYYICRCKSCGFEKSIAYTSLVSKESIKCNNCNDKFSLRDVINGYSEDISGHKFGDIFVESFAYSKYSHSYWNCLCKCGNREIRQVTYLKTEKNPCCRKCAKLRFPSKKDNKFESFVGYVLINNEIIIDENNVDLIKKFNRYISINSGGYAYFRYFGDTIFLHRFILGLPNRYSPSEKIIAEHINGNRLDNRIENLRICEKKLNPINCKEYKTNTSGQKGVSYLKRLNKWQSNINYNNKSYYLGVFENFDDAVYARKQAEIKLYKGFNRE